MGLVIEKRRSRREREQRWGWARGLVPGEIQATFPTEVSINLAVPSSNFFHLQSSGQHKGGVSTFWKLYKFLCSCTYEGLILEIGRVGGCSEKLP